MNENLKKFLEYASQNEDVRQKLDALESETDKDTVIAKAVDIAKEAGFTLSAADFEPEDASAELSEDELDEVAGGKKCTCVFKGTGKATLNNYWAGISVNNQKCSCSFVGSGNTTRTDPGAEFAQIKGANGTKQRCHCIIGGSGIDGWYNL